MLHFNFVYMSTRYAHRTSFFRLMRLEIRTFLVFLFPSSPAFKVQSICEITVIINNFRRHELAPCSHETKGAEEEREVSGYADIAHFTQWVNSWIFSCKTHFTIERHILNVFQQMPRERAVLWKTFWLRHNEVSIKNAANLWRTLILKENNHFLKNICTLTQDYSQ